VLDGAAGGRGEDELKALGDYAVHAAAAMTAAVLGQEVRELGAVDPLTRFFNVRYFRTRLEQETQRALRTQRPVSVAVMTLDGLQEQRASGDEVAADEALEQLAGLVVPRLRAMDVGCRIAEDELAAILPDVGGIDAYRVGERLRQAVMAEPALAGRTLSLGIATFPEQAGTPEQLAECGRNALGWAERHGGDRTFLYTHEVIRSLEHERRREEGADGTEDDTVMVTVQALASAVDARHPTTVGHAEGVARVAAAIAAQLGLEPSRVEDLRVAGLLHDVGKIGVSEEILVKEGPLTPSEWEEIRRHPEMGHRMLSGSRLDVLRPWVLHHHERLDGTGYPQGLAGEEIPYEARILAVADAYDAMVHDRPYRSAISREEALAELERCAGTQFDPDVVTALVALVEREAPELTDGPDAS
jgi:diguanylate cyclase (GGDEF)-like protein